MTREEQILKVGEEITSNPFELEGFIEGAEWADEHPTEEVQRLKRIFESNPDAYKQGRKEATERAVEFIYAQQLAVSSIEELINELRKYMEGQQ